MLPPSYSSGSLLPRPTESPQLAEEEPRWPPPASLEVSQIGDGKLGKGELPRCPACWTPLERDEEQALLAALQGRARRTPR